MALPKLDPEGSFAERPVTDLGEAVRRANSGERVIVRDGDQAVAVMVSIADLRRLEEDDRRRNAVRHALEAIADRFDDADPDQVERSVQETIAALRGRTSSNDTVTGA